MSHHLLLPGPWRSLGRSTTMLPLGLLSGSLRCRTVSPFPFGTRMVGTTTSTLFFGMSTRLGRAGSAFTTVPALSTVISLVGRTRPLVETSAPFTLGTVLTWLRSQRRLMLIGRPSFGIGRAVGSHWTW